MFCELIKPPAADVPLLSRERSLQPDVDNHGACLPVEGWKSIRRRADQAVTKLQLFSIYIYLFLIKRNIYS